MFIICREGHLGKYWNGNIPIFLEKGCGVFPSRKECLRYLMEECGVKKEQATYSIVSMQKSDNWVSF